MRGKLITLSLIVLLTGCMNVSKNKEIKYSDLVGRLTDLKSLAVLPVEGEKSAMWSSYDRRSKVDSVTSEFVEWSANDDGLNPQYIRKEGDNMVLAEMEGPGAIVRIWSASPAKGRVKIYIDGEETPVVDQSFIDYFNTGSIPAFNYPQLVYETAARGYNNYVPIPYQSSCKIVAEPGWGQYYHFNYISFPAGTKVDPFQANPNAENAAALAAANNFFENQLGQLPYTVGDVEETKVKEKIAAGASKKITIKGSKAIYSIKAHVKTEDEKRTAEALRKLILQINWDNEKEPAVWSPIGDFFGSSPGYNLYTTLPMGMMEEAMYSYWYMPFRQSATITLENNLDAPVEVDLSVGTEQLKGKSENYARFHAKWHRNFNPVQDSARWPDWTVLETRGQGRFLGMSLMVWNPKGGSCKQFGGEGQHWWGEGDEKFFVDGETFPSTFGTGTEDYFGYAWCIPNYFTHPFHSQSRTEENMGYQSLNRWQVIDNVPFQKSFKGYMEKYFPDHWPTQYAVVAYWYLNEGGEDPIKATPVEELYGFEIPYDIYRQSGVVEGESMQIVKNTGGWGTTDVFVHEKMYNEVSGHKVLLWYGEPNRENELHVTFNIDEPGTYKIKAQVVKSPEGGRFRLSLNNRAVNKTLDMKSEVVPGKAEMVELGNFDLKKGEQVLKFHWIESEGYGRNLMVDFIGVEPTTKK